MLSYQKFSTYLCISLHKNTSIQIKIKMLTYLEFAQNHYDLDYNKYAYLPKNEYLSKHIFDKNTTVQIIIKMLSYQKLSTYLCISLHKNTSIQIIIKMLTYQN